MKKITAKNIRKRIFKMAYECGGRAHLGGSLSMVELLTVLYRDIINYNLNNMRSNDRDKFILSKGHCVLGLFATLVELGIISENDSKTFLKDGSKLGSHPVKNIDIGIECSSGSLGQGISFAVGIAKANKIKKNNNKVYVLIGNGECNEGSVWEAIMLASQWKLDNLTIILDNNKLQSDGDSNLVISMDDYFKKFDSFNCNVFEVDGHNEKEILEAFNKLNIDKPKIIIANTIKGKGASFMENDNNWHHNRLSKDLYDKVIEELGKDDGN